MPSSSSAQGWDFMCIGSDVLWESVVKNPTVNTQELLQETAPNGMPALEDTLWWKYLRFPNFHYTGQKNIRLQSVRTF